MLRKIRVLLALFLLICVTLLFLDFTGTLHAWLGWSAMVQFVPALLALNIGIVAVLLVLTLFFGRIYCSVICPLGVLQDGVSNIAGRRKGKRNRFCYSSPKSWLRYGILALFIIAMIVSVSAVVSILDPYAAYGRIASSLFAPLYGLGNNLLAQIAERVDSYAFYSTEVWVKSWIILGVAILTFVIVGILAWRNGRIYCNTICPVGTILGFVSKFSLFKPVFENEKCNDCGLCSRNCKSSCIDLKTKKIDYSRCVTCFNCIDKCKSGAMKYAPVKIGKKKDEAIVESSVAFNNNGEGGVTRRNVLSMLTLFAATNVLKAQQLHVDGGLATIEDKKMPNRKTPIAPPGAFSTQNMKDNCTACQLCVSVCPNHILRPSSNFSTFMQPEMSFERGYCRPECVKCSEVCPTGAIKQITKADKSALQIGHAEWIKDNCVVLRDEIVCINCERHCPTGAIVLVAQEEDNPKSLKTPIIDTEICIGCGACENLCPSRPYSAIYIEGHERHRTI